VPLWFEVLISVRRAMAANMADDDFLAFFEDFMPWLKVTYEFRLRE